MAPSKQWTQHVDNRLNEANSIGVQQFLDYAFRSTGLYEIRCPCVKCCYTTLGTRETLESHLKVYGIVQNYTLGVSGNEVGSSHQNALYAGQGMPTAPSDDTISGYTISAGQGMQTTSKSPLVLEKEQMQTDIPLSPYIDEGPCITRKLKRVRESGECKKVASLEVGQKLKGQMLTDIPLSPSTDEAMQYPQSVETGSCITRKVRKVRVSKKCKEVASLEVGKSLKQMQTDIPLSPSTDEVTQYNKPAKTSSYITKKVKNVRGINKGKEVASLEVGQKLKVHGIVQNCTLGVPGNEVGSFHQNALCAGQSMPTTPSDDTIPEYTLSAGRRMQTRSKSRLVLAKEQTQTGIPLAPSTNEVIQPVEATSRITRKLKGIQESSKRKKVASLEVGQKLKGQTQTDIPLPPSTDEVMAYPQSVETSMILQICKEVTSLDVGESLNEQMQTERTLSPSTDEVMQYTEPAERNSCITRKVRKVRGSKRCKEVASLEVGQRLNEQMQTDIPLSPSTHEVMQYTKPAETSSCVTRKVRKVQGSKRCKEVAPCKVGQRLNEQMQTDIPLPPSTDGVMQCSKPAETNSCITRKVRKVRGSKRRNEVASLEVGQRLNEQMQTDIPLSLSTDEVMQYTKPAETSSCITGKVRKVRGSKRCKEVAFREVEQRLNEQTQTDSPLSPSTDEVMQYTKPAEKNSCITRKVRKVRGSKRCKEVASLEVGQRLNEQMQTDIPLSLSTDEIMQYTKPAETSSYISRKVKKVRGTTRKVRKVRGRKVRKVRGSKRSKEVASLEVEERPNEQIQSDIPLSPCTDEVMQYTRPAETSSCITRKVKKVRGSNKCKVLWSLEVGEKLKVTFYNNRTVGENSSVFSRFLGKLVRDRNMCPLGVSSWHDIKEEKLNNLWAAVEDKFENDDMDSYRDHIMGWMKELWNKWRGQMHCKFVKGRPIEEALQNVPRGVDKKDWEWLIKEHFSSESFQARSSRASANRAKLKMPHHIGSKPIREIIYQQGGKDGNPPDLTTVFFETHKKDNKLVEPEAIERHARIQKLVQAEPSLPNIEIVERCFGPQKRSHVFGFGGGLRAKDLKGPARSKAELVSELRSAREENQSLKARLNTSEGLGGGVREEEELGVDASSKAELVSELHSAREENQALMDRLSAVENEVKELKQLKELLLAKHYNAQSPTSSDSEE